MAPTGYYMLGLDVVLSVAFKRMDYNSGSDS